MLGASYISPYFLNPGFPLWLLVAVGTLCPVSLSGHIASRELRGEVGGNVSFCCRVDKKRPITLFYFQSGDTFINGYYEKMSRDMPTWENTRLDRDKTCVDMFRLNISHSRLYRCIIRYRGSNDLLEETIQLNVTATYSKPTVTTSCDDKSPHRACLVTCASHGGYPGHRMEWTVNHSSPMWRVVNRSDKPSHTMLFNSSSTALFNCSNGQMDNLRCSVGDVSSLPFSVCEFKEAPGSDSSITITAVCVICAAVLAMVVALLLYLKCKNRRTEARGPQENNGETVVLNERNGGEQIL